MNNVLFCIFFLLFICFIKAISHFYILYYGLGGGLYLIFLILLIGLILYFNKNIYSFDSPKTFFQAFIFFIINILFCLFITCLFFPFFNNTILLSVISLCFIFSLAIYVIHKKNIWGKKETKMAIFIFFPFAFFISFLGLVPIAYLTMLSSEKTFSCKYCNKKNHKLAKYCSNCGHIIERNEG